MSVSNELNFTIDAAHPSLAGHFPNNPVVPGVVILDEIAHLLFTQYPGYTVSGLMNVKFLQPLRAEQPVNIQLDDKSKPNAKDIKVKFTAILNNAVIAQGEAKLVNIN